MSQQNTNEIQAGTVSTLTGGGLMYLSSFVGDQLNTAAAAAGEHVAVLDVMSGALPASMFSLGAVMTAWGVNTLAHRLSPRGRVRARYNNPGWADHWQLRKHLSSTATIKVAAHTREAFKHVKWYNRAWHLRQFRNQFKPTDHGVYLGKSIVGPTYARQVYASYRDVILVLAPPQSGKTAWLTGAIIDAVGAVVATSTKADIYHLTHQLRRANDRPVLVFNPAGVGNLTSTLRWNPVRGCGDLDTAEARAASFTQGVSAMNGDAPRHADADFWEEQAAKMLRCFLLAAAVTGRGMEDVARWSTSPNDKSAMTILRDHRERVPDSWLGELRQILNTPAEKTRESIFLTLSRSVKFMSNPAVAQIVAPGADEESLDLERFIDQRGTLYVLGENSSLAPLLVALSDHLFSGAKAYASTLPGGRLEPPMSFILDEAALIVPVDLVRWVADAGGRNIQIIVSSQALAQLYKTYGERGGQIIKTAANTEMIFGGLTLHEELRAIADACGPYTTKQVTETDSGTATHQPTRRSTSKVEVQRPIIEPALVRQLPEHHVLILHRTAPPTIVRTTPAWERSDVKRVRRQERRAAKRAGRPAPPPVEAAEPAAAADADTSATKAAV
jgi:type IV secretory pathway TraG/TraD family ATPase VirD4